MVQEYFDNEAFCVDSLGPEFGETKILDLEQVCHSILYILYCNKQ